MLSHFNLVNNANLIGRMFGLHEQNDSICLTVPLVHCYGCVGGSLTAAMFGATLVMPSPSFKAKAALEAIAEQRCTFIYGTPTMYIDMIKEQQEGKYDVSSVRKGIMGGASCPQEVVNNAMTTFNMQQFQTTTSPRATVTPSGQLRIDWILNKLSSLQSSSSSELLSIGSIPCNVKLPVLELENGVIKVCLPKPFAELTKKDIIAFLHIKVKIVDSQGRIVPVNQSGELCARGYLVFKGYLKQDDKTREVVRDNWYHTG
ncbi:medium-chain acyl-CoA ligase ACSF2, mitochondrial [Ixodes scapularis]|uniref:medium-chain acyl-CoA ligase ACSF2, mitochondrial n=1 Tax=Ixodes scapularis TaxID=6945 RepID=UPI001C38C44A|nr:medium-chain acyl-CoA ligase ACSF2, mitochondrial [Ixodes scapularis]